MIDRSDDRRRVAFVMTAEIHTGSLVLQRAAPAPATSLLKAKSARRRESFHGRITSSNETGHKRARCNVGKGGWLAEYGSSFDERLHPLSLQK